MLVTVAAVSAWALVMHLLALVMVYRGRLPQALLHASGLPHPLLDFWHQADTGWYTTIVNQGYVVASHFQTPSGEYQDGTAFLPGYPMLLWVVTHVTGLRVVYAGMLIGPPLLVIGAAALYRLVRLDYDHRTSVLAVLFMIVWPSAMFFLAAYGEALLMTVAVLALLMARRRRWLLAGGFAGLAVLIKPSGLALLVPLIYEAWSDGGGRSRPWRASLRIVAGPVLALAMWMGYLQWLFGQPLRFITAQRDWGHASIYPGAGIIAVVEDLARAGIFHPLRIFDGVTLAFLGLMAVYVFLRVRRSYGLFLAALFLGLGLVPESASLNRYMLAAAPLFIGMAVIVRRRRWLVPVAVIPSALLSVIILQRFVVGAWAG